MAKLHRIAIYLISQLNSGTMSLAYTDFMHSLFCLQTKFSHSCQRMKWKSCDRRRREKLQHCAVIRIPDYWMPPTTTLTRMPHSSGPRATATAAAATIMTTATKRRASLAGIPLTTPLWGISMMRRTWGECGCAKLSFRIIGACIMRFLCYIWMHRHTIHTLHTNPPNQSINHPSPHAILW